MEESLRFRNPPHISFQGLMDRVSSPHTVLWNIHDMRYCCSTFFKVSGNWTFIGLIPSRKSFVQKVRHLLSNVVCFTQFQDFSATLSHQMWPPFLSHGLVSRPKAWLPCCECWASMCSMMRWGLPSNCTTRSAVLLGSTPKNPGPRQVRLASDTGAWTRPRPEEKGWRFTIDIVSPWDIFVRLKKGMQNEFCA